MVQAQANICYILRLIYDYISFNFQTPTIYEHIPLNLTDISVEPIPENVFNRKNVFRLKSDIGEDYSLLADSDSSMQSWIQALEDSISAETAKKKGSRKSLTSRNRSPSIQSPMTKNRKGSAGKSQTDGRESGLVVSRLNQ